jgi:hypothetical protein
MIKGCRACDFIQRSARENERAYIFWVNCPSASTGYLWHTNEGAHRARAQEEMTVNFDALHERARERGWTLTKSNVAARYGTMPIRFILRDKHGMIYFRNLDEVERRLNAKAKQS